MKPTFHELKKQAEQISDEVIRHHLERLDERYYQRFDVTAISRHLSMIAALNAKTPVMIDVKSEKGNLVAITICSYDYPAVFSIISGLMSSMGFDIRAGGIHTYTKSKAVRSPQPIKHLNQRKQLGSYRRKIIDHFSGYLSGRLPLTKWKETFIDELQKIIGLLETNQTDKAKHLVNDKVASQLNNLQLEQQSILFPVEIEVDNLHPQFTRLKVISEDTPFFLYAFSNALNLHNLAIEHIKIKTTGRRVEDIIDVVDRYHQKIEDEFLLNQVKLSLLLTKQFTYFLAQAPDPYAALSRFDYLVEEIVNKPQTDEWTAMIGSPWMMEELAKVLGASDYLWEDMIRQQYETLLPMLQPAVANHDRNHDLATLPDRLEAQLEGLTDLHKKEIILNQFKDQELFRIDLDYILSAQKDFRKLSEALTFLAEVILRKTIAIIYDDLVRQYGHPRTVAGLETKFSVLGLGKMGGAALGYASDIELMIVYSDQGHSDGRPSLANTEFYDLLVRRMTKFIHTKREGIFNIDLRLRPYGTDGPLASSLELFCQYYGQHGPAHAIEKLALVRLRPVAGDQGFGEQLQRLRDDFIYATKDVNLKDCRDMRLKQFADKISGNQINAKFSPGALVDLEYDVQILQIMYGHDYPVLRTPRIQLALQGLHRVGVLDELETQALTRAYGFLRNLINGLRMLRGSAKDLFLPPVDSLEYTHLARRLGYRNQEGLDSAKQLHIEFETHTAAVRAFVEKHFGRDALPGPAVGNVADLILSSTLNEANRLAILTAAGFKQPARADVNFMQLADAPPKRQALANLIVLAADILKQTPDPDMALNNWEHFVSHLRDPLGHYEVMRQQPMRLTILLDIFATSQFLSDTLVNHPEYIETATDPQSLHQIKGKNDYERELKKLNQAHSHEDDWLNAIRLYRRREMLRIGTKDICLKFSMEEITLELTNLAEGMTECVLDRMWTNLQASGQIPATGWQNPEKYFCLLAFGKLGGQELNYSSDIDLVALYDDRTMNNLPEDQQATMINQFSSITEALHHALSSYTEQGYVYRVDFRLRPHGIAGQLVTSFNNLVDYYQHQAELSEIQSLLKMRCIAGNIQLGHTFLDTIRPLLLQPFDREQVVASIEHMRNQAIKKLSSRSVQVHDVKSGRGGIRDIEFLIQGLQLIHNQENERLLAVNSFNALKNLADQRLIDSTAYINLLEDYSYLRRIEHFLQIYEDRQIHALPRNREALDALAKRNLGKDSNAEQFLDDLQQRFNRVRHYYQHYLLGSSQTKPD